MDKLASFDTDHILEALGLQRSRSGGEDLLPAAALFGVGFLVGAGAALLLAPRAGRELRDDLAERISHAPDTFAQLPQKASDLAGRAAGALGMGGGEDAGGRPPGPRTSGG
jgi:hypothetical protein